MIITEISFFYLNICRYERILLYKVLDKIILCKIDFFSCEIIIIVINYNEVQKFQQADFLTGSNPVWSFED